MSISTIATKDTYAGNASISTAYPVTFKYLSSDHVTVYADGVDITNTCTFAGDGTTGTGEFTTAAYAPTTTIVVVLDVPLDQPVSLQETGSLPAKTIEVEGFDRLNMQVRRVWRKLQDVLTFNTDEAGASTGTADNLLGFDGSGDIAEIPNSTFVQTADGIDGNGDVTITAPSSGQVLSWNGSAWVNDISGNGDALVADGLDQFAQTTSLELKDTISDETGSGALVFATSPTLVTPALGTPSAVDLTNATNTPLPATGTITEAMLNASTNASLDLADTAIQTETNGTVQGSDNLRQIILANANNAVTPNARAINSIDLQPVSALATQIPSSDGAVLLGGLNNTADAIRATCISGTLNTASGANAIIMGGYGNTVTGEQAGVYSGYTNQANGRASVVVGGNNNIATGVESLVAGGQAGTATNVGARVFPDSTATAITSRQQDEFAIQASALRLEDGNEAVGKVLTCNNADGSSNWAATTVFDVRNYGTVGDGTTDDTTKIQDAIDAAEAACVAISVEGDVVASGVVVDLAGGLYAITDTLTVDKNIKLQNGSLVATQAMTGTTASSTFMLKIGTGAKRMCIDGVDFDGGLSGTTKYADLIEVNAQRVSLNNIMGIHFPSYGIRYIEGQESRTTNVTLREWLFSEAGTTDDTLRTAKAFSVEDADMMFTNCVAAQSLYPFYISSALNQFVGCHAYNGGDLTPSVEAYCVYLDNTDNNVFTGCYFDNGNLYIKTSFNHNVTGCHFQKNANGSNDSAIFIDTAATDEDVSGLIVVGCTFNGTYSAGQIEFGTTATGTYYADIFKKMNWIGNLLSDGTPAWYSAKEGTTLLSSLGETIYGVSGTDYTMKSVQNIRVSADYDNNSADSSSKIILATDGTDRYEIGSSGELLPSVDNSQVLGNPSNRLNGIFSNKMVLIDGVNTPNTISGHASIYVDTADGDLKVKFGDGTVKTISVVT